MTVPSPSRLVVGCMTGTSIDALDAALVRIHGRGLDIRAEPLATHTHDLGDLAAGLRTLADQRPMQAAEIATLAHAFSRLHAEAVAALLVSAGGAAPPRPDLICVHGQTVAHRPPVSWQLFSPWPLARAIGAPIVFDLRGSDLAAGGQGAPITPIADWILFRAPHSRAVINLGGFCNITLLPTNTAAPDAIRAADVCACNQLLDALARARLKAPFDHNGEHALRGKPNEPLVAALTDVLKRQSREARSLGTGDELAAHPSLADTSISPQDALRSACRAIARTIVDACPNTSELILAGGGVRNAALIADVRLAAADHRQSVSVSDALAIPAAFREAIEFAILGALCHDGVPITLPAVTGVSSPAPLAGCWVPAPARAGR